VVTSAELSRDKWTKGPSLCYYNETVQKFATRYSAIG